jgi:RNA polymerase sigma factor (sigma-70 family)
LSRSRSRAEKRKALVIEWLPLVRVIAACECQRLGSVTRLLQIDFDDLFQTGVLGLIAAIDHFNPELSSPKTYFTRRIRGAMIDFLRSFPYFKNGKAIEKVGEAELNQRPVPCLDLEHAETHADFERLINYLPYKQRLVLMGVAREIPQHLLARSLGVNESRISQIKNESLSTLRSLWATQSLNQRPV